MEDKKTNLLTQKELEIMQLYMIGLKKEQISRRLNASVYSIGKTFKSVIKKLNVENKIQAAGIIASEIDDIDFAKEFLKYRKDMQETVNISFSIDFKFKID